MQSLLQDHELVGKWWLPENPAEQSPGTLHFTPGAHAKLSVSPGLIPIPPFQYTETRTPTPIFNQVSGVVSTGDSVALGPVYLAGLAHRYAWAEQDYLVPDPILVSQEFRISYDTPWTKCEFELTMLEEWFDKDPVVVRVEPGSSRIADVDVNRQCFQPIEIETAGCLISIALKVRPTFVSRKSIAKLLSYSLSITPVVPATAESLVGMAASLRNLFALLTLAPILISSLRVSGEEVPTSAGPRIPSADILFQQPIDEEQHRSKQRVLLASSYECVQGELGSILTREFEIWMRNGLGELAYVLLGYKPYRSTHSFTDFANLIFALEGDHARRYPVDETNKTSYKASIRGWMRKHCSELPRMWRTKIPGLLSRGYEPSFPQRVSELVALIPDDVRVRIVPDPTSYKAALGKYRQKHAHGVRIDFDQAELDEAAHLQNRTILLMWAIALTDLGFSPSVLTRMIEHYLRARGPYL